MAFLAVGCSSSPGAAPVDVASNCAIPAALGERLNLPPDLEITTTEKLPISGAVHDPDLLLVDVPAPEPLRIGIFFFNGTARADLVPEGATAQVMPQSTGPKELRGAVSMQDGRAVAAVMGRSVEVSELMRLLHSIRVEDGMSSVGLSDGTDLAVIGRLAPSDVPGIGSVAIASRRDGEVQSLTNNAARSLDQDQRAVVVGSFCNEPHDKARAEVLAWWYGVRPEKDEIGDRVHETRFEYGAPAENGTTTVHLWEYPEGNTVLATFGLDETEAVEAATEGRRQVLRWTQHGRES